MKDENENKVGEVHFRIVVNEMFGEMYEDLWRISRRSLKLKKIEANFLTERALK